MYFTGDGCGRNTAIITCTIVFVFICYVFVFVKTRRDASVLTTSIVFSYFLYLQWVAFSSASEPIDCNPYIDNHAGNATAEIICGCFFNFFALLTIAGSMKKDEDNSVTGDLTTGLVEHEDDVNGPEEDIEGASGDAHVFPITPATILFQLLMVLSSIYFAMLMTNWGEPGALLEQDNFYASNMNSYWINMSAMWVSQAIFLYSLLAPMCMDYPN